MRGDRVGGGVVVVVVLNGVGMIDEMAVKGEQFYLYGCIVRARTRVCI